MLTTPAKAKESGLLFSLFLRAFLPNDRKDDEGDNTVDTAARRSVSSKLISRLLRVVGCCYDVGEGGLTGGLNNNTVKIMSSTRCFLAIVITNK